MAQPEKAIWGRARTSRLRKGPAAPDGGTEKQTTVCPHSRITQPPEGGEFRHTPQQQSLRTCAQCRKPARGRGPDGCHPRGPGKSRLRAEQGEAPEVLLRSSLGPA